MKNGFTKVKAHNIKAWLIVAVAVLMFSTIITRMVFATAAPKYFVCKYVGTPGVNEKLQTGQNPISVSANALTPPIVVGGYFNDAQGRSYVVAQDTGQDEPDCPIPVNDEEPKDVCPNLKDVQETVPEGMELKDGQCVNKGGQGSDGGDEQTPVTPTPTDTSSTVTEEIVPTVGK